MLLGSLGPVFRSAVEERAFSLTTVFELMPQRYQRPQACVTTLYRSTECRCRRGAPMTNLAHRAFFHAQEETAPSNTSIHARSLHRDDNRSPTAILAKLRCRLARMVARHTCRASASGASRRIDHPNRCRVGQRAAATVS